MVYAWELEKIKEWSTEQIKNCIWQNVHNGQPIPCEISVQALRMELRSRGEEPSGYHGS